jgi:short-subunit dehydrogenase
MSLVLIIGATSDIARAVAHQFAKHGYDILLAARNTDDLASDVTDLNIRHGVKASAIRMDVRELELHRSWYEGLVIKPDVAICVSGYMGEQSQSQADSLEAMKVIDTNFTGCATLLEVIAADFEEQKKGAIVAISSVAGLRGRKSNYIYGSAKAGFIAFLSGLRNRLSSSGVPVLTVLPGFVATRMTESLPLPGILTATPQQVAGDIYKAYRKKKSILYTRWYWRWIMTIIRCIPEGIFRKLNL